MTNTPDFELFDHFVTISEKRRKYDWKKIDWGLYNDYAESLEEALLDDLGLSFDNCPTGLILTYCTPEFISGDDTFGKLLKIAHLIDAGSHIDWLDADTGDAFRWYFNGTTILNYHGHIVFDGPPVNQERTVEDE